MSDIDPTCAIHVLNTPEVSRASKFDAAWRAINDPDARPDETVHAYIWIGYRVLDGEVKKEDWNRHAERSKTCLSRLNGAALARWDASLRAVNIYNGEETELNVDYHLDEWPNNLSTYCRMMALMSYGLVIQGRPLEAAYAAKEAIQKWRNVMSSFDYCDETGDARFAELYNDSLPLECLAMIACGSPKKKLKQWVVHRLNNQPKNVSHWWTCMQRMQRHPNAIF
jgi:hypothetical protein